jgi:ABC-type multidrug transport system ATPase subunit
LQLAPPDPLRSAVGARRRAVVAPPIVDYAVEAYDLRKVYRTRTGKQAVVDGLDLRVPVGGIHGFLGPNGSGKTTTIRMLLGLIAADAGYIRIFDHEVPLAIDEVIGRVGAIVEQPRFFPAFSAQKNLQLLASAIGAPRRRVAAVLDEVRLAGRRRDKFRNYSLGMKQRLAIAATLLKDPDLLIFDEPTNGLDPAGIHEIRDMMRRLARRGKTVLVSSHVLSEVQQIADTVTIIGRGRLLAEGDVNQILASDRQVAARVGVSDHLRATEVLTTAGFTVEPLPNRILKVSLANHRLDLAVITRLLADQGLYVSELTPIQPDLESVFLDLTAGQHLTARQERRRQPARRSPQQRQRRPQQQQQHLPERRRQPELPDWGGRP